MTAQQTLTRTNFDVMDPIDILEEEGTDLLKQAEGYTIVAKKSYEECDKGEQAVKTVKHRKNRPGQ